MYLKRKRVGLLSVILALAMMAAMLSAVPFVEVEAAAGGQSYADEKNALTPEEYAEFGLTTSSPEEFDPDDPSHPLENYESTYFSELCVGKVDMNAPINNQSHQEVSFPVADNTTSELSANSFDLDHMLNNSIGSNTSQYYQSDYETVYGLNLCAVDVDGDGTDEIATLVLCLKHPDYETNPSCMNVSVYDFDEKTNEWKLVQNLDSDYDIENTLAGEEGNPDYVSEIEVDTLRSYTAMAAGDYNDDGLEELAVYIPTQKNNLFYQGPEIAVYGLVDEGSMKGYYNKIYEINLKELQDGNSNVFDHPYNDRMMPVVSLATTHISGQDDLVVNVSQPMTTSNNYNTSYGQGSAMGIYHFAGSALSPQMICRYMNKNMQYGSTRMRFSSALDADVDGNGVDELVVGGYKNTGFGSIKDVGVLDASRNLLQLICWNDSNRSYEEVFSTPKEVESRSGLRTDTEMMEPAALAAGRLHTNNRTDQVFLEGNIFSFRGTDTAASTEKGRLSGGAFSKEHSISLASRSNAFISVAYAGAFAMAGEDTNQLVILSGGFSGNEVSFDVIWVWEDDSGEFKDTVTNSDYPGGNDEKYPAICPLNVDQDKTTDVKYEGKEYGWSDPTLYCVLQSPPYWSELQYNSETYGAGEVSYAISCGSGSGTEGDWGVGLGLYFEASAMLGPQILGNKVTVGGGFELGLMASYVGSYGSSHGVKDSVEFVIAPGEDQVIVLAVPLVTYHYKVWVPEYVVTQEDIDNYNKQREAVPNLPEYSYNVGDTVPGSWETYDVQATLDPAFSNLPVEEYNKLVEKYGDTTELKPITEETLAGKKIGDPSTYPHSDTELKQPGNVNDLHVSKNAVRTVVGESGKKISYEIESESELSNGFQLSFDGSLFIKGEAKESCPFIATAEEEAEGGVKLALDGGCSWVSTSTNGMEFSTRICDLPEGSDDYGFTTQLAVFNISGLSMGAGNSGNAYCVGYIVKDVDEDSAPPKLPIDLRVFTTTENAVVLKWDKSDYRQARSYEIYGEDNNGKAQLIGSTTEDYYVITELNPGTQYRYAIKAYSGADCQGNASVLSRWVVAVTKDSSDDAPKFTQEPSYVDATPGDGVEYSMTAKAEKGAGMEDAVLTYQWQKANTKSLTGEVIWEDVKDGTVTLCEDGSSRYTLPGITQDMDQTHYRVIAVQTRNGNVKSTISKIATLYVNGTGGQQYYELDMGLSMVEQEGVYQYVDDIYCIEKGTQATCTVSLSSKDGVTVPSGGKVVFRYRKEGNNGIEEGSLGTGTIDNNTSAATITLNCDSSKILSEGVYELYAVYPGETAESTTYLPAQSDKITLHVLDVYHVTYHMNGGVNNSENPTMLTNESPAVELKAPTRNYYNFEGWYRNEELTIPLENSTLDPSTNLTGDVELYAKWTPIAYTISYELNGGENSVDNPSSYTIEDTVMLQDASREDYIFAGWYLDKEFTDGPVEKIPGSTCADVTLYAKWEEEEAPFEQDKNGRYLISSYADLVAMAQKIQTNPDRYANAKYVQTCNINCEEQVWELPIGTEDNPFNGTYEGYDYYVLGLRQTSTQTGGKIGGLFGVIGERGTVQNLSVVDFDYSEPAELAGGLAGINRGTIVGCGSGINISSSAIIFRNGQPIPISTLNSDVNGTVSGGLVGRNEGIIQDSRSNAVVNGSVAGGIAGENAGRISNIYNTGAVTGTAGTEGAAGGIAGKNAGTGSIQYGYSNKVVSGSVIGGIAGSSDNANIQNVWYLSDMAQACGNQEDAVLLAGQMTADEMKSQAFCDTLNNAVSTEQEETGLRNWTWSSSENEGCPRIEKMVVVQQTLSSTQYGISVSGQIHPGAHLRIEKISGKGEASQTIKDALHSGTLLEEWHLALVYEDGTCATWEGDLAVSIKPETKEKLKNLSIFHLNDANECSELETSNDGEYLIVKTKTLGNFGVVKGASGSQTIKPGSTEGLPGSEEAGNVENGGNTGGANTGDMAAPVVLLCALLVSCIIIMMMVIRKRKYQ